MSEIRRVYKQSMPKSKFVGICYGEKDMKNGTFSDKWSLWFENDLFSPLRLPEQSDEPIEGFDAYYGLCRCNEGKPFQYWIGVFMPDTAVVPDGYESISFDAQDIAVCWVYGKEPDVYKHCCLSRLADEGIDWVADRNGYKWMFERYVCPRFTEPDENGNIILDLCYFI